MTLSIKERVDLLGGPTAVGRIFGVSAPSVCAWNTDAYIPDDRLKVLEILFPSLFPPRAELVDPTVSIAILCGVSTERVQRWASKRAESKPDCPMLAHVLALYGVVWPVPPVAVIEQGAA